MCKHYVLNRLKIGAYTLLQRFEKNRFEPVNDDKITYDVCSSLEAIFLHGLLGQKFSAIQRCLLVKLGSSDQPSFWDFIKCLIPKHLINIIGDTNVRRTEVGCCRVWIRFCLNEASLHSYLSVLKDDSSKVMKYYSSEAILNDKELLGEIISSIEMMEELRFKLDLYSPLLNSWSTSDSLKLLGLIPQNAPVGPYQVEEFLTDVSSDLSLLPSREIYLSTGREETQISNVKSKLIIERSKSWKFPEKEDIYDQSSTSSITTNNESSSKTDCSCIAESHSMLKQSTRALSEISEKENFFISDNVLLEETKSNQSSSPENNLSIHEDTSLQDNSWNVIGEDLLLTPTEEDVSRLVDLFPGSHNFIYRNGQNCVFHGVCARCSKYLKPNSAFLDHYDHQFYCANCHQLQEAVIPRDVIMNWDFSLQPVSQTTRSFLTALHNEPVINLAKLNPTLYAVIPNLLTVRHLRRALVLLWHQIARCDAKAASDLSKCFQSRAYMFHSLSDLDLYSVADLLCVHSGHLEKQLTYAITNVALIHVHRCQACRRRALLCDICEELDKPIWLHEFTTYKRCITPGCPKIMHIGCLLNLDSHDTNLSCFQSRSMTNSSNLTDKSKLRDVQCQMCRTYSSLFSSSPTIRHYADPFINHQPQ